MSDESDTYWLICPYCQHRMRDAWEVCGESENETDCHECGKSFICWADTTVTYCTKQKDDPANPEDKGPWLRREKY